MNKLWKPFGFLVIMILLCSVMVRLLSGSETLFDYAQENPEIAYATPEKQPTATKTPIITETPDVTQTPDAQPTTTPMAIASPNSTAPGITNNFVPLAEETAGSTHYADGFFYQDLTDSVIAKITGISYPVAESIAPALALPASNIVSDEAAGDLGITYDDLCYMNVLHYDFNGEKQIGELICNKKIADDLIAIFHELYLNEYQIEKIRLVDEYGGDDTASMLDNNTSCFNYRVVDGTTNLSKHAIGCAIDINPFYNPYVVFNKNGSGETYISPEGSEIYADRSQNFPYKIDENDLCYKLFKKHGFIWGGDWNSCKDYQHFQKVIN